MSLDSLTLSRTERVVRARNDLAMGLPFVVRQEAVHALAVGIGTVDQKRFEALKGDLGTPTVVITPHRARAIMSAAAASNLGETPVRIRPPEGAAFDLYQRIADPKFDIEAGPIGPLHVLRSGDSTVHEAALRLAKAAQIIPALALFSVDQDHPILKSLAAEQLSTDEVLHELAEQVELEPAAVARLPLDIHHTNRLHVFHEPDGQRQHYALEIGSPDRAKPVLARLHSACFTGDVLGSLKCDCGPQLHSAMERMAQEGAGVLLYLNQEGRGIGLANKMRVYDLQDLGFDTVEANHQLGFDDDERDFGLAATILKTLGFADVRLLTNNPSKVDRLEVNGVHVVERLPLKVGRTAHNHNYLSIKALKSGHIL